MFKEEEVRRCKKNVVNYITSLVPSEEEMGCDEPYKV